jgi:hypothetical protein
MAEEQTASEPESEPETKRQTTAQIAGTIALSEGLAATREALERRLARDGYSQREIAEIVASKEGFGTRFAAAAIARLATRSVPGALAVSGGLILKALFDRRRRRRGTTAVDEAND